MSGHNKWSTIKQKKGKNDAARAKVFTKIGRELIVAIREGGSADPLPAAATVQTMRQLHTKDTVLTVLR